MAGVSLAVAVEVAAVVVDVVAPRWVAWTVAGALALVAAVRFLQLGLELGSSGVRVVNLTHTVVVPWERVRGFAWEDGISTLGAPSWPARLRTPERSHRITATWAFYPRERERIIDALRPFTTPRDIPVEPGRVGRHRRFRSPDDRLR